MIALLVALTLGQSVVLRDEGMRLGEVTQLSCVGAGITCSKAGGSSVGVLTVTGGAGGAGGSGGAPTDAPYVVFEANASLSAERVLTNGTNTTVDLGTPGQAKVNLSGTVPQTLGGTGAGALTCTAGQALTSSGTAYSCATQSFSGLGTCNAGTYVMRTNANAAPTCAQVAASEVSGLSGTNTGDQTKTCGANTFVTSIAAGTGSTCTQPAFSDLSGSATIGQGGTTETASTEDAVLVGASTTDWQPKVPPSCSNAATSKLLYDVATNTFSCGTDQTSAGGTVTLAGTTTQSDAVIATYTAITGIAFTPAASTNYLIDCWIVYTSSAATTGINFAWDVPVAAGVHMVGDTKTVATGANEGFSQNTDNVGTATSAAVITTENLAILSTVLRNGANSTSTTLGFTPETANSVSVIGAKSLCQYRTF